MQKSVKGFISCGLTTLLLAACGGNASDTKSTLTFTVDDVLASQKKAKDNSDIKEVSITDLEGNTIGTAKEIEPRKYSVDVDKDIPLDIKIKLVNGKNGEITLERFIEKSKSEETTVDQDSTHIATYIRESASENNQDVKEYLDHHKGDTDRVKSLIDDVTGKDFINKVLADGSTQNLEELSKLIAEAIKQLERINAILERIQARVENFQNGSTESENEEPTKNDISLDSIADQIESHGSGDGDDSSVEIGENGNIVVVNNEGVKNVTVDGNIIKEPIVSGEVISSNDDAIVIGIRSEKGSKEVSIYNNGKTEYITSLLKNIHSGDRVIVKYEENDQGKKFIARITGSGKTVGVVTVIKDNSLTLLDEQNYSTEFTARWINDEPSVNATTSTTNAVKEKSGFDPVALKILSTLKINDKAIIKWEINERKRILYIEKIIETTSTGNDNAEPIKPPVEPVKPPVTSTENQSIHFDGNIKEKGDGGFSLQKDPNNSDSVFIAINKSIPYQKEILESLLVGDQISVSVHKGDNKYILDNAKGEGSMSGSVLEKSEIAIWVKNAEGKSVKFTPEWHDGGLDAAMLAKFKELAVGASITVKWKLEERKRAISISLN
jgi:hypothetical protein